MKKKILTICLLLIGIGVLAYPVVSNYIYELNGSFLIDDYSQSVSEESSEEIEAMWKEAYEYNENLLGSPVKDPFIEGSGVTMPNNYSEILNVNGMMGSVKIPKISVDLPIYHTTKESVLKKGVGHLEGSTLPVGGEGTHAVLTGHTGLSNAKLFTDLDLLEEGDMFYLYILDDVLAYEIDEITVIDPEDTQKIKRVDGEDYVTLLTCTPYGVNSHRLLVRGKRVPYDPEVEKSIDSITSSLFDTNVIVAAIITSVIMLLLICLVLYRKKKGKELNLIRLIKKSKLNKWGAGDEET
ncbi:class C sortase [Breznakia pachnodae]|uniref:Sortase A n=1 Tax=Breznakia pachnodae TaxID=265178 RepID=A0ABU0E3B5_9FIRM|nr:class C sortase [Breznakia pachnodae]MDQ0361221.1 sortase A [Breznakia pachnodae]